MLSLFISAHFSCQLLRCCAIFLLVQIETNKFLVQSEPYSQSNDDICIFSDATVFKTGDSVRLRMDSEDLKPEFFDEDLTHNDIGYILERNDKERVIIVK